jgi:hypothetical protein
MVTVPDARPSLAREIGKLAWLAAKLLVAGGIVFALLFFTFREHPIIGVIVLVCIYCIALIVYAGWQNYRWKLQDLEWKISLEADRRKWEEDGRKLREQWNKGA